MKKLLLAALLAATAVSADAAVTFQFTGNDQDGAAVSGALTIDTDLLVTANGAAPPALNYYFSPGDATSTVASSFLSLSFTGTGTVPALIDAGDYTYQLLQADPGDGSLALELDWQRTNADSSLTSSRFTLSGLTLTSTNVAGGALLPDLAGAGTIYFDAASGTGPNETYDAETTGTLSFAAAPAAVPEASTWIMLVLGFGVAGAGLRRQRPRPLAA